MSQPFFLYVSLCVTPCGWLLPMLTYFASSNRFPASSASLYSLGKSSWSSTWRIEEFLWCLVFSEFSFSWVLLLPKEPPLAHLLSFCSMDNTRSASYASLSLRHGVLYIEAPASDAFMNRNQGTKTWNSKPWTTPQLHEIRAFSFLWILEYELIWIPIHGKVPVP